MNKLIIDSVEKLKTLELKEDTSLVLKLNNSSSDISIKICDNVNVKVTEISSNNANKVNITLGNNSNLIINKICLDCSDHININLDKEGSSVTYNTSIINYDTNTYTEVINHNARNTTSTISNHAVNVKDNNFAFDIDATILKDITNCSTNQDNRIINLGKGINEIKPNLLVDNDNIDASHSAYIGRFDKDKLFYMQSRGISKEESLKLLVLGFLLDKQQISSEDEDEFKKFIQEYI